MAQETAIFTNFLKKKNLKSTKQRQEILNVFLKSKRHLSVEDLYNIVKKNDPGIGQATVFRVLKLLCESGLAKEVKLGDKKTRFELKYGHQHHDHLVCVNCGKFIEVLDPRIEDLQEKLCQRFGFSPKRHRMEIFGTCKKCRRK